MYCLHSDGLLCFLSSVSPILAMLIPFSCSCQSPLSLPPKQSLYCVTLYVSVTFLGFVDRTRTETWRMERFILVHGFSPSWWGREYGGAQGGTCSGGSTSWWIRKQWAQARTRCRYHLLSTPQTRTSINWVTCPKDSTALENTVTSWVPSVQIYGPL